MSLTKVSYSIINGASVNILDFGASPSASADVNTAAIAAAITYANDSASVYFPSGTYQVTGTIEMPLKVSGNFTINGNIKWSFKKEIVQEGEVFATGSILLDSVWYSNFNYIKAGTTITLQSSNATWGVFWNKFENVICAGTLIINVDQGQSVNQNVFVNCVCSGGLHIAGTNVSGIREAHNNLFISIDTTGANLSSPDGTTGIHILNDSNLNQTNAVQNWYAENTGARIIKGNWDVFGSTVDANNQNVMIGRSNSYLNARALSRNGSFVSQIVNNLADGGDWGSLGGTGFPLSLSGSSATQALVTDCPDGGRLTMKVAGGGTFRSHDISYRLTTSGRVTATAYVYQEGTPSTSVEIYDNLGTLIVAGAASYTAIGGLWYLLRIAGESAVLNEAAGITTGTIRIYTTTSSALTSADFRQVASYIVTTDSYCPLPSRKMGYSTVFSTAIPTGGFYEAGTVCLNIAPSAGGTPGWVCVTSGTPGTWKEMANLAV